MPRFRICFAVLSATILFAPLGVAQVAAAEPEETAPQGEDPPGADNGAGAIPLPPEQNGVIPPPDIGDEDIHTEVPNPGAGHEEEVIPPPSPQTAPHQAPR